MASILIRNLEDSIKTKLRVRAAHNNRSMEDEARSILRAVLSEETAAASSNLADSIHNRFKSLGGLELQLPTRAPIRKPPQAGKK